MNVTSSMTYQIQVAHEHTQKSIYIIIQSQMWEVFLDLLFFGKYQSDECKESSGNGTLFQHNYTTYPS